VLTDPPYYDNVLYSDLSDFFYVWLKRVMLQSCFRSPNFCWPMTLAQGKRS
jgi:adenine-specific DNA methylase